MKPGVYITCCLLLLCGCAQTNWHQSLWRPAPSGGSQRMVREREMVEKLIDETVSQPRSSVPLLRAQNPDNPGITITSSSAAKTQTISHDAATLALIDKETRDFSPEDRERAVAALKAIPSESVPAVLQLWKAGLISQFGHPTSPVVLAPASASELPVRTALASDEDARPDTGLGQKSPWPDTQIQQASYVPRDWNPQAATFNQTSQSQTIARVNTPAYGFSSPFPSGGPRLGLIEAADGFDAAPGNGPVIAGRNGGQPPQYGSATAFSSASESAQLNPSSSVPSAESLPPAFDDGSGRRLVMPRQWQSTTSYPSHSRSEFAQPQRAQPQRVEQPPVQAQPAPTMPRRSTLPSNLVYRRPANPVPPPQRTPPPLQSAEPQIRPQGKSGVAADRSAIQRAGYSEPLASLPPSEIPLTPGQALPGFEQRAEAIRNPVYEQQLPSPRPSIAPQAAPPETAPRGIVQSTHHNDQPDAAWRMPPTAQRTPTPEEALRFLVRATEAEVDQLQPGKSAAELQYYIERHVYLRLLYLMSGQTELALRPIPNIPAADQEFWTQVLWGVQSYFDLPRIPNHAERAAQTIAQFNTAMLRLKERAPLELKNVAFCHKIEGYGEYETYQKDEFSPGERVLIYAEVGNFHSELSAEGIYRTRLKSTLQVVANEAPQEPIDVKVYPVTEDYCRNHRRDYFHSYVVEIPVRCVRGAHTLQLIIEDEQSGKVATHSVPFVVR